eukprot:6401694-Prymnesium_polylepis.1
MVRTVVFVDGESPEPKSPPRDPNLPSPQTPSSSAASPRALPQLREEELRGMAASQEVTPSSSPDSIVRHVMAQALAGEAASSSPSQLAISAFNLPSEHRLQLIEALCREVQDRSRRRQADEAERAYLHEEALALAE